MEQMLLAERSRRLKQLGLGDKALIRRSGDGSLQERCRR
jgi:hypothetical protein